MKKILLFLIFAFILLAYAAYDFLSKSPQVLYSKALKGEINSSWYSSRDFTEFLSPDKNEDIDLKVQNIKWWKLVQLGNYKFPLPYRHPLYRLNPILPIELDSRSGLSYLDNHNQEILRLFFYPGQYYSPKRLEKRFYQVPIVDYISSNYEVDSLWKDLFTRVVPRHYQNYEQAIKDLYLLEQRLLFFPKKTTRFGSLKQGSHQIFYIEFEQDDKDYKWERFFIMINNRIYSFDLKTFYHSQSAKVFRSFILKNVKVLKEKLVNDEIAYSRFESLDKESQKSEEGIIHLFSAWSQKKDAKKYIREMIYYAEKSQELNRILPMLYAHSYFKYKKLFPHEEKISVILDSKLAIQRQIEIEQIRAKNKEIKIQNPYERKQRSNKDTIKDKIQKVREVEEQGSQKRTYRVNSF